MKSKLEALFDDESFARDSISNDNGIMITDEGESPYRDILVKGSSKNREVAKNIATRKLNRECKKLAH